MSVISQLQLPVPKPTAPETYPMLKEYGDVKGYVVAVFVSPTIGFVVYSTRDEYAVCTLCQRLPAEWKPFEGKVILTNEKS